MKEIPLGQSGKVALVDDEDYEYLTQRKWHLHGGYVFMRKCRVRYSMHRIIMDAKVGQLVDHIDRDKLNNQRSNLRFVTPLISAQNSGPKSTTSSSKYKGVHLARSGNWRMMTNMGGIYSGMTYTNEVAAAHAYNIQVRLRSPHAYINDLSDTGMTTEELDQLVIDSAYTRSQIKVSDESTDITWRAGSYMNGAWYPVVKTEYKRFKLGAFEYEEHAIVAYNAVKQHIESNGLPADIQTGDLPSPLDVFGTDVLGRIDISV